MFSREISMDQSIFKLGECSGYITLWTVAYELCEPWRDRLEGSNLFEFTQESMLEKYQH
jgi:hypothetical protein